MKARGGSRGHPALTDGPTGLLARVDEARFAVGLLDGNLARAVLVAAAEAALESAQRHGPDKVEFHR